MSRYARGAERERELARLWRSDGWVVSRSAGSHGSADLICLKKGHAPRMIQLKTGQRRWPSRDERAALRLEAARAGAMPLIAFWEPRKKPEYVLERDWPA